VHFVLVTITLSKAFRKGVSIVCDRHNMTYNIRVEKGRKACNQAQKPMRKQASRHWSLRKACKNARPQVSKRTNQPASKQAKRKLAIKQTHKPHN